MHGKIWNYVQGYVIIRVEGLKLERFINLVLERGLKIWHIKRLNAIAISACISASDFYQLRKISRRLRCRIHIISKYGAPFIYTRWRFRPVILFGWMLVVAAVFVFGSRVWVINVDGCNEIEEKEIRMMLGELDIKEGSGKNGLTVSELGEQLRAMDSRIGWAGARLTGVVLSVEIVEAELPPEITDYSSDPRSIVADKEGIIQSIVALNGQPLFKNGESVKKGEVLITGDLSVDGREGPYVCAAGKILAQVPYMITVEVGASAEGLVPSGNTVSIAEVSLFGWSLRGNPEYEQYSEELVADEQIKGLTLPIKYRRYVCSELVVGRMQVAPEDREEKAQRLAEEEVKAKIPSDAVIIAKTSEVETLEDGTVRVTVLIRTEEYIGVASPIG